MKTLFALAAILVSVSSANAATLLEASRMPGFEMHPQSQVFTVDTNGQMTLVVKSFRENTTKRIDLGKLSKYAIERIEARIANIKADEELVDPEQGKPMCTDTPSTSAYIYKDGVKKEISRAAGCHEWKIANYDSQYLAEFGIAHINL